MKSGQLFTAMVTPPMHKDGSVNYRAAVELAQRLAQNGSDGGGFKRYYRGESPHVKF